MQREIWLIVLDAVNSTIIIIRIKVTSWSYWCYLYLHTWYR